MNPTKESRERGRLEVGFTDMRYECVVWGKYDEEMGRVEMTVLQMKGQTVSLECAGNASFCALGSVNLYAGLQVHTIVEALLDWNDPHVYWFSGSREWL